MEANKPVLELELYLIRHGQSMGNKGYGRDDLTLREMADPVLTDLGKAQADALGKFYATTDFDAVYSSGLFRAVETASRLLAGQKREKTQFILPYLTEVGMGEEYKGATLEELREYNKSITLAEDFTENDPILCYSQGRDEDLLYERAKKTVEYIRKRYNKGEKVALVSHAAYLTYVVFQIMGYQKNPFFDVSVFNTSVTKINFYKEGTNKYGDVVFDYLNSTTHLLELETTN